MDSAILAGRGEWLAQLANVIPLPALVMADDGSVENANDMAHECLGVPAGTLPGRLMTDFIAQDDPVASAMCRDLRQEGAVQRVEVQARRSDGQPLWLILSAKVCFTKGKPHVLVVFEDITALKRKERELTEANEQAERSILARMRFLAAASHDLRQPLQALALFASALDQHVTSEHGRTIIRSLKTSLRGMEEMFDALLDMSKLDAGVMTAEPRVFMINDIFEQMETIYAGQAEAAGLEFRVVPSSATVRSDPRLLARMIGNFLSNAIRYTRQGRVLLGCHRRGHSLRVVVYDTGPGIPESQRLEIFREFRQVGIPDVSGRGGGMGLGLGLAIVQRLARLLGHRLDVRSTEGKGSAFAVEIPLADEPSPAVTTAEAAEPPPAGLGGATVVVVDDSPEVQDGLRLLLEEWGGRPVVAATAAAAIAMLSEQGLTPDLVLADLHLGAKGSGIAAIQAILDMTGRQDIPAFVLTADTQPSHHEPGFPILRKPIDPVRLRRVLAEALGR